MFEGDELKWPFATLQQCNTSGVHSSGSGVSFCYTGLPRDERAGRPGRVFRFVQRGPRIEVAELYVVVIVQKEPTVSFGRQRLGQ
jgi:hypothetical protein